MLLFPGEADYYRNREGYRLVPCAQGTLLICPGRCRREERPLSCRLFPLLPLIRQGGVIPAMDRRGRSVCPLVRQSMEALDPAFVAAVARAGEVLLAEAEQACPQRFPQSDLRGVRFSSMARASHSAGNRSMDGFSPLSRRNAAFFSL